MTRKSDLYNIVNGLVNIDISFILDDIIGHFAEPDIPINIELDNFQIDIDTPYGEMHLSLITEDSGSQELTLKRTISNTFHEEYKINLNKYDEDFLCLDGKTIELRNKGFIITNIEKNYNSSNLTGNSEVNRQRLESGSIIVDSIDSIIQVQEVYFNKVLHKIIGDNPDAYYEEEIFKKLCNIKIDFALSSVFPQYINMVSMHLPESNSAVYTNTTLVDVKINGYNKSDLYPMWTGLNAVGRAYKIYQGIIDQENYKDAIRLINAEKFLMAFAHEDYEDKVESISKMIESLIGAPTTSHKREYTAEVRNIAEQYRNHVKHNPFLFDDYNMAATDKKRELEKNKYIKQILLSNHDNM